MELTAVRNLFPELSSCNGADDGRNDFIQFPCSLWIRTVQIQGQNILFMILLATMMIPWDVTMIPQYMEFNLFGWINTLLPLIVPTWFGSAYYVFLMRQFLMGIPKRL